MKVVNISNEPFEFQFDGGMYCLAAGEVKDLPDEIARHGVVRGTMRDDTGGPIGSRLELVKNLTPERLKEIAMYSCPYASSGLCDTGLFKSEGELKNHMMTAHWRSDIPTGPGPQLKGSGR